MTRVTKNLMEELVEMQLDDCMNSIEMCRCESCREDVRAYALNHLPPKYVVTNQGGIFASVHSMTLQTQANIMLAIMQGVRIVNANPRHDER